MKLIISGEIKTYEDGITISQLIKEEKVETPDYVTVSVNTEFPDREAYETTVLNEGDQVEFLYFMGGGAYGAFQ
ncbi:MAG: sulfur carrier protein ThiS [Solobacterium sp.]|nr:sulfur carrier protein ThiS [Solobacterium sp.]